ncbi:GNAT family N-acetyltransferase [Nonomuraea soli]|uniref:CelD/BcsL family acetyltransferase involved in cellulose biosynthesis n=1 Tax=Nonomuraea soli TaxID=1032476 RepID=A0A7W0CPI4_9ACTN|nr:GNAT family N-acetyltransferase [Nonomuraea soli]MBA2894994.1 CelD/BcsL family acetyltransferase involved in cellulose biosynthesis [Nonomuraea soli]
MKIHVVRPGELGDTEIAAWRAMQDAQPHLANPFLSPEFAVAMGEVSPHARVAVLDDGRPAGFLAYELNGRGVGAAIGAWVSLGQGLVHRPDLEITADELLGGAGLHVYEYGTLVQHQPWFEPFETLSQESVIVDVSNGFPAYLEGLSKQFVSNTFRKERKLGREVGEVSFDFDVRDEATFRLLLEWKSGQYRAMGRPDRFAKHWVRELAERLWAIDTPAFAAPLSILYADGKPVAGHFGPRSSTVLVDWFPAYDPALSRYSPGLIMHLRLSEAAAAHGVRSFDLSVGTGSQYKNSLRSHGLPVGEGIVRRRTAGAAAHWVRTEPVRRTRRFILESPVLYGAADRLMRRMARVRNR